MPLRLPFRSAVLPAADLCFRLFAFGGDQTRSPCLALGRRAAKRAGDLFAFGQFQDGARFDCGLSMATVMQAGEIGR